MNIRLGKLLVTLPSRQPLDHFAVRKLSLIEGVVLDCSPLILPLFLVVIH
jgi:hypothetical protein